MKNFEEGVPAGRLIRDSKLKQKAKISAEQIQALLNLGLLTSHARPQAITPREQYTTSKKMRVADNLHLTFPNAQLGIPRRDLEKIDSVARNLFSLFQKSNLSQGKQVFASMAQKFSQRFDTKEVPILDLFSPSIGLMDQLGSSSLSHNQLDTNLSAWLLRIAVKARDQRARSISFSQRELAEFVRKAGGTADACPDSWSNLAQFVPGSPSKYYLRVARGPHFLCLIARFLQFHDELREESQILSENRNGESAEIVDVLLSDRKHVDVNRHPKVTRYAIDPYGGNFGENILPLSDLFVYLKDGRLKVLSKRLGREIRPVILTAYNYMIDPHPIVRFLGGLSTQESHSYTEWSWGAASTLDQLPRVEIDGIIVSPRIWKISKTEVPECEIQDPQKFANYLIKERGLDEVVLLSNDGLEIPVDLKSLVCKQLVFESFKKEKGITFKENLLAASNSNNSESSGHTYEFSFPSFSGSQRSNFKPNGQERMRLTPSEAWVDKKWSNFYLSVNGSGQNRLISDFLKPWIERQKGKGIKVSFFFVRMADPEPHIRFRFKSKQRSDELLKDFQKLCDEMLRDKVIWDFCKKPYAPELSVYGKKGIESFEAFSDFSSNISTRCVDSPGFFRGNLFFKKEVFISVVEFSWATLNSSSLSQKEKIHFCQQQANLLKESFQLRINSAEALSRIPFSNGLTNSPNITNLFEGPYGTRLGTFLKHRRTHQKEIFIERLIHLHCNRCYESLNASMEFLVYKSLLRLLHLAAGSEITTKLDT
jgi:thiopeptide-type bacteriocin biosynthesis protein